MAWRAKVTASSGVRVRPRASYDVASAASTSASAASTRDRERTVMVPPRASTWAKERDRWFGVAEERKDEAERVQRCDELLRVPEPGPQGDGAIHGP